VSVLKSNAELSLGFTRVKGRERGGEGESMGVDEVREVGSEEEGGQLPSPTSTNHPTSPIRCKV
jgi:hypothetical protein